MSDSNMSQMPEDQLPQEVVAELRKRLKSSVVVPNSIDEAILADARDVLTRTSKPQRRRFGWRSWTLGVVSAGSLAAALFIMVAPQGQQIEAPSTASRQVADALQSEAATTKSGAVVLLKEDFDGDGSVNILDALALARRIDGNGRGTTADDMPDGDLNSDGVVDRSDVDLIAMSAVTL